MSAGDRSRHDSLLITALASGATVEMAAQRAGVSPSTAARRLRRPEFRDAVAEEQRAALTAAMSALGALSLSAVRTLGELLRADHPPSVRLRAAAIILAAGGRLREEVSIEERLTLLEAMVSERREGRAA